VVYPDPTSVAADGTRRFVLYLEGPRDRGILRSWSYRMIPALARRLFGTSVILGGRQPARALEHFRQLGGAGSGVRAVCVLDRDDRGEPTPEAVEPGLEFFTWSRRHIESYLLVPDAIARSLDEAPGDRRVARILREHIPPPDDEAAFRSFDAKRVLGPKGVLTRELGRPIALGRVARVTRETELHPDVHALFARLRTGLDSVMTGAGTRISR
jgi:hypothetical protein